MLEEVTFLCLLSIPDAITSVYCLGNYWHMTHVFVFSLVTLFGRIRIDYLLCLAHYLE